MSDDKFENWSSLPGYWKRAFKYKCSFPDCVLQFQRKDRLDAHEATHDQVKKFKCTQTNCDKAYACNSHLKRHIRVAHSNDNVECPHCDLYFKSEDAVKNHCYAIHSDKKSRQFECEICNEKFRRKTHLQQHMFEHTGTYRYKCDKCGKGFLTMSRLKRHEKSHRPRQCKDCAASFDKWSLLMAHRNEVHINSELKCSICDREFGSRRLLTYHRKIHTDSNEHTVFNCPFDGCTKTFTRMNNMQAHFRLKHENQKFPCTYNGCTMELCTKQKLELHIKVIHLGECVNKSKERKEKRAPRKDKGIPKISTASKFFKFILPSKIEEAIIAGQGSNIHIEYDRIEDKEDDRQNDDEC